MVTKQKNMPILRYYNVFHLNDYIGIESKFIPSFQCAKNQANPIEVAEHMLRILK